MCHLVYFSTTSGEDFSKMLSEHFQICPTDAAETQYLEMLAHSHRWYLMSRYGGCSCHFRHDINELGFGPVEDWSPEESDDIASTLAFFDLLRRLLDEGHRVDVLDVWDGTSNDDVRSIEVALGQIPRDHFRFLEGVRLSLAP